MLIRCFIPFENRPTFWSIQSDILTSSRTEAVRERISSGRIPRSAPLISSASRGVREAIDLGRLDEVAARRRAPPLRSVWTDTPLMNASPSLGKIRSVNIFSVVVLPAPFGPRNPMHLDPSTLRLRWSSAVKVAESLRQSDGFDAR